ncbi:glycoside hydrolase [Mucilaginibacter robiniae]|uniref:Glycoside hydrolase n=1 Tax=Mucilaginibacter robiniae TaxID=2728022 RepID=A0A7L5DYR0_9SPHI|nr:NlpC/P60 family protein [Mucilaginibacter robiniae]QJD95338.1 glycoside hydrolase [Mucilaginibacter robiniae]
MKKLSLAIALFLTVLSTQAQTKSIPNITAQAPDEQESLAKDYFSQIMGVAMSATSNVKLFQFVYDWIGTPYHLGGDTKNGIDCSGFAYQLYNKVFNTAIGNNSRNIFSMVNPVDKEELKEGDLVFFKIHSRAITHVGVYIGNGKFAHASSSKGVMISYLADPYWTRYYYKGGRLLNDQQPVQNN